MPKDISPVTSPQVWRFADYLGRALTVSISFNVINGNLTGAVITRDEGCLYRKLYWGLGEDGTPDTTTRQVAVPFGTTTITRQQMNAIQLLRRIDITAVNFTAGP